MKDSLKMIFLALLVVAATAIAGCHSHQRGMGFHTDYDNHYYGANHPNSYWTY